MNKSVQLLVTFPLIIIFEKKTAFVIKDTSQRICFTTLTSGTNSGFCRPISNLEKVPEKNVLGILQGKGCLQKLQDNIKLRITVIFPPNHSLFLKRILSKAHPPFANTPGVPFPDTGAEFTLSSVFPEADPTQPHKTGEGRVVWATE